MALQLLKEGVTFEVKDSDLEGVTDGDPDTVYKLRQIPPSVNREVAKRHGRVDRKSQAEVSLAAIDDLVDYALIGWSGVLSDGVEAPCVRETKLCLDYSRKSAIVAAAGLNKRVEAARDASFRSTP